MPDASSCDEHCEPDTQEDTSSMSTSSPEDSESQARAITAELREAGFDVDSPYALRERYSSYAKAVPVLIRWLPLVQDMGLKETLLRNLAVRSAKPALPALIEDFKTMDTSTDPTGWQLRWAAGNAIETAWDDNYFDDLAQLATDPRYGRGREMIVRGLAKSRRPEATDLLLDLLADDEVVVAAVIALRKHPRSDVRASLEARRPGREAWVQREIDKTLAKQPV